MASINDNVEVSGAIAMPDGSMMPISPEQALEILQAQEEADRLKLEQQKRVLITLEDRIENWVRAKAEIEKCAVDDLRQYEGFPRVVGNKEVPAHKNISEAPRIHRTRSRTDMMEARLTEMLLTHPSWRVKLPKDWKPEQLPQVQPDENGQMPSEDQLLAQARLMEEKKADGMQNRLCSIMADSRGKAELRKVVRDACRVGTGLMMGPNSTCRYKRKVSTAMGKVELVVEEKMGEPEVKAGDFFCFFPEPVDNIEKAQGAAYVHLMNKMELQEFAKQLDRPGTESVARLSKQKPQRGQNMNASLSYRNQWSPFREEVAEQYAVWRYIGILEREECEALGLLDAEAEIEAETGKDVMLDLPMVDIWFCQGEVLKMKLRPLQGDFRVPYYLFTPFPREDCMFGYSLAYQGRDSQRAADAAYEMLLHNASVSSGPLVFAIRDAFKPKRGETMEINGPKWMWAEDDARPLQDLVHVVNFPNAAEQMMSILDRILQIMDDELNMPQVIGDVSATKPLTQTASGMAMLMNEMVTIFQRRAAMSFDEDLMLPMLERLHWWEMIYGEDDSIKGDFEIEVIGQSELLVKDMRIQHLMMLQQMYPNDPDIDDRYIKEEIVRKLDVPVDRGMRSLEEAQAMRQQAGQDPKVMAQQQQNEVAMKRAQLEEQNAQRDDQFRQYDRQLTNQERMAELEHKREQDQKDVLIAQLRQQTEFAKLAQSREIDMTKIQAMLGVEQTKRQADEFFRAGEMKLKAAEIATRQDSINKQVQYENPVRIAG